MRREVALLALASLLGACSHPTGPILSKSICIDCGFSGPYTPQKPVLHPLPIAVAGGLTFKTISVGERHVCALSNSGLSYCWGGLGFGTSAYHTANSPEPTAGGVTFTSISAGANGTCGIATDGRTMCWGDNGDGELGIGQISSASWTPAPVSGGLAFTSVQLGGIFSTAGAYGCALAATGAAYCWGSNTFGQLGTGGIASAAPAAVAGGHRFASISSGSAFTCGITSTGPTYCWGLDETQSHQLGSHAEPDASCTDRQHHSAPCSLVPVKILFDSAFVSISAGSSHVCALVAHGEAYCWGGGMNGALGNGAAVVSEQPLAVIGAMRFVTIAAGSSYTCALTASGEAFCWGNNGSGQLGDGTSTNRLVPTRVDTAFRFSSIAIGNDATCAITKNGAAYCWGSDLYGRLGKGS